MATSPFSAFPSLFLFRKVRNVELIFYGFYKIKVAKSPAKPLFLFLLKKFQSKFSANSSFSKAL